MEFRNLELFLNVAATGSFSRAATLAGSTQSSVSKGIAALEAELSTRLFDRTGRGVTLTAAGRALLDRAEARTLILELVPQDALKPDHVQHQHVPLVLVGKMGRGQHLGPGTGAGPLLVDLRGARVLVGKVDVP